MTDKETALEIENHERFLDVVRENESLLVSVMELAAERDSARAKGLREFEAHQESITQLDSLRAQLAEAQKEVAELRRVLKSVEWGSCDGCSNGGSSGSYCVECCRGKEQWSDAADDLIAGQHASNCSIAAALAAPTCAEGLEKAIRAAVEVLKDYRHLDDLGRVNAALSALEPWGKW